MDEKERALEVLVQELADILEHLPEEEMALIIFRLISHSTNRPKSIVKTLAAMADS